MSLVDEFKEPCTLLEKTRATDGEGGWYIKWVDGPKFMAAIVMDNTMSARVAMQEGMSAVYTVTVDKTTPLEFHDAFRRDSDGQVFRVTSDSSDKETPGSASFQFGQVSAERWELPNE